MHLFALLLASLLALAADPELERSRADERRVLDELRTIDERLAEVRRRAEELRARVADIEARLEEHEAQAREAEARLEAERESVRTGVAVLYRLQRTGLARVVFGTSEPTALRRRARYALAIVDALVERMHRYAEEAARRRRAADALQRDLDELAAARAELAEEEDELRARRQDRVALLEETRSRRELALRAVADMRDARRSLGERIADAAPEAAPGDFRAAYGRLPWPVAGRIVRRFGRRRDPVTGVVSESKGIDIAAAYGAPVRAVFPGVVVLADYVVGYGQTVAVQHGAYTTVYAHLNGVRVRRGQRVRQGDLLGLVGNTGLTEGAEYLLTFEIRYNRTAQDPLPWLQEQP